MIDEFVHDAQKQFDEVEGLYAQATTEFQTTKTFFAEEPAMECEEFFGTIGQVLAKMEDARQELAIMKRKEQDEQRKLERLAEEQARKVVYLPWVITNRGARKRKKCAADRNLFLDH